MNNLEICNPFSFISIAFNGVERKFFSLFISFSLFVFTFLEANFQTHRQTAAGNRQKKSGSNEGNNRK